ncbi:hypothetical protein DASB73_019720 [Starmerella bacillaris]|uniref:Uncharacterized protein n=1 Tax=Starmerella bacillaris TaxID=1247836 RepID=A0AAV5RHL3_STABA|nr:hypothetical protein DASB73_019720 [Starmerella bacillaris]
MEWVGVPKVLGNSPAVQYGLVTVCLAGLQFAWSIEQSYFNIYLIDLGMTKAMLSIMWIACPLCGLLVQPIIGSLSDYSTSRIGRRRPYMVWGAILVTLSLLSFAWSPEIAVALNLKAVTVAMISVIIVDISINICQSCCRALVVDMFPGERQIEANGWAGFMSSIGHLISYLTASCDLSWLGFTNQLKAVCVLYSSALLITISISSAAVTERVLISSLVPKAHKSTARKLSDFVMLLWNSAMDLEAGMKSIFKVQMFAWYAWFTFLFYGATYAAEVWSYSQTRQVGTGDLARKGSLALTVFSFSATVFGYLLPRLPFKITNIWSATFVIYAIAVFFTGFTKDYGVVLFLFGLIGITWAATLWIPFSLTAKEIHNLPVDPDVDENAVESTITVLPEVSDVESQTLPGGVPYNSHYNHNRVSDNISLIPDVSENNIEHSGLFLGLHNASITIPQFVSTFGSYIIFKLMDVNPKNPHDGGRAIAVTLQVGAIAALLAAFYARKIKI